MSSSNVISSLKSSSKDLINDWSVIVTRHAPISEDNKTKSQSNLVPTTVRKPKTECELFSIVKILSVTTNSLYESHTNRKEPRKVEPLSKIKFSVVAFGGFKGHEFIAAYASNDYFLFRYVDENGVPLVRQMPWFKEASRKIMAMDFDPTARWLCVVTADLSIVLIPIFFVMLRQTNIEPPPGPGTAFQEAPEDPLSSFVNSKNPWLKDFIKPDTKSPKKPKAKGNEFGPVNDVTVIRTSTKPNASRVTSCLWWNSWTGSDFIIISSISGIRIVDLRTHEPTRIKCKFAVLKMDIIIDPDRAFKYLLLKTNKGGSFKLLLEQRVADTTRYDTIIKNLNHPAFLPVQLKWTKNTVEISKQIIRDIPFVGVFDKETNKLEVYDHHINKYPTYVYQLPEHSKYVHIADKNLFVIKADVFPHPSNGNAPLSPRASHFSMEVLSSLLSGTSENTRAKQTELQALLQLFKFPESQKPRGYFRGFSVVSPDPSDISSLSQNASSPILTRDEDLDGISKPLSGFYFWTEETLYEVRPRLPPESIFFQLVTRGLEKEAEPIGKTFDLNLLRLYELAADKYFEQKEYGRSLELYYWSNVKTNKLVSKFVDIERIDIIITKLRALLLKPAVLTMTDRKTISTILLKCYVQRLLQDGQMLEYYEQEFQTLLTKNTDYDTTKALNLCLENGLLLYFLQIAHSRNLVERALSMLAERGIFHLGKPELDYLKEQSLLEQFKTSFRGAFVHSLPPEKAIQLYLEDPYTVSKFLHKIFHLLPELDEQSLTNLASYFNPLGENMLQIFNSVGRRRPNDPSPYDDEGQVGKEAYVELFLTILLVLVYKKQYVMKNFEPSIQYSDSNLKDSEPLQGFHQKKIKMISIGWNHSLALTVEGEVYSWGRNHRGQLGIGNKEDKLVPSRISTLNTEISLISCGGEHSVAIDDCNVYVWGSSRRGQLGIQSSSEKERLTPIRMDKLSGHKFIKIECGYFFTVALTTDGLYLWGDLMNSKEEIVYSPVKVQIDFIRISQLSCGYSHVAILTTNGEVWTFGNGSYGQLGHEDLSNQENPKLVESLCGKNIRSISCGSLHTVAVTDLGNVSTWGSSHKGCLGYPSTSPHQVSPKLVSGLRGKNIIQAFAGHTHTIVTTENDEVYVWGEFKNLMELSVNNTDEDAPRRTQSFSGEAPADNSDLPMVIPELYAKQIKQLECGDQFTIFLSADQTLYSWGSGQFGQLGHGDILDFTVPTLIETTNESEILQKLQVENTFVHEDQGEFNEKFLLETLQIQQSYYRPHVMLSRAKQWKNWNAVSTIYETQGKWDGAISARLMQIKIHYGKSIDTLVSSTLALLQHLKDELFGKLALSINNKDELLYPVLEFWKENKLPMAPLSKFVCSNLDVLAPILGEILKNNKAPNPFCVNFDLKVYVHITKKCMETTRNAYLHGSQDKPPEDRMWTQIKNNIAKDLDKKDKILLDPEHVPRSAHEKDFMFTCGHSFTREKFYSEIIPTFEDKTQQFSHPLPITTRLMVMDYQQHQISLSCPVCAYNELRKNQKTIHKKWEL